MYGSDHVPGWKRSKVDGPSSPKPEPTVQVPASPNGSNASGQKRPTSMYRRPNSAGQFQTDPKRIRTDNAEATPTATRLVSLSDRFSYKSGGSSSISSLSSAKPTSTVFSRYSALLSGRSTSVNSSSSPSVQTKPSIANPVGSAAAAKTANDKIIRQLVSVFPSQSRSVLQSAVNVYKTFDAAADFLAKQEQKPGMTAKREVSKPSMSIRQKFSSSSQQKLPAAWKAPSVDTDDDDEPKAAKSFKRLVKQADTKREPTPPPKTEEYSDESDADAGYDSEEEAGFMERVFDFLNSASKENIADIAACTEEVASVIVSKRPYSTLHAIRLVEAPVDPQTATASAPKKGRRGPRKTLGEKIVDACSSTLRGYEAVDSLIKDCDELGKQVAGDIKKWGVSTNGGELDMIDIDSTSASSYFTAKPALLADDLELKDYQQVGINWLSLLYSRNLSCILADEMGLGKTCQVISFLAHLKEIGIAGPHLIVVPASTLENWLREFQRFCPTLKIEPYYGSQNERADIRDALTADGVTYDVMVTTYNLACGGKMDLGFLKTRDFNVCVYDEGHMLKNSQSERYAKLMKLRAKFRLLLTGTPLQNNLQELVSLLSFMMPKMFEERKEDLAIIFKHKAKASDSNNKKNPLLSEQRIQKAKTMMTPFILRRRKAQVLQHLPGKTHEVVYCDMTDSQAILYEKEFNESKKISVVENEGESDKNGKKSATPGAATKIRNVLMQLRKAALHPLLFREEFNDETLKKMAREIMKEERYATANEQYIYEDMEVMNDLELTRLCEQFPATIGHHEIGDDAWFNSGKVKMLQKIVPPLKEKGDRILIFSQFTQVLDILERSLDKMGVTFIRLDGQTPVDIRQDMIDKYHNETDITVFLLSTKAGGFGINLACANVVIIFDLSFNPHDDKQAEDRAHRVGQTQEVKVIRMITRNTIEENILALANTKLALDKSVAEGVDDGEKEEEANESSVAKMMGLV